MRLIFILCITLLCIGCADKRAGISAGIMSSAKYGDNDKKDVSIKNKSWGLEYITFDRRGAGRLGLEYRNIDGESDVLDNVKLYHSAEEILGVIGYALHGERIGSTSVVAKLFGGIGVNKFYFYNTYESRKSKKTEEKKLEEFEVNNYPYGWEVAVEILYETPYLEFGMRGYESNYEIKYLNADIGKIKQDISYFAKLGIKWR